MCYISLTSSNRSKHWLQALWSLAPQSHLLGQVFTSNCLNDKIQKTGWNKFKLFTPIFTRGNVNYDSKVNYLFVTICHFTPLLPPANEVWGKVIFLHQSVILFTRGSSPIYGECLQFWGVSNFWGGSSNFQGGFSNFSGGLQFFSKISFGHTVNAQAVCILLECILVTFGYICVI